MKLMSRITLGFGLPVILLLSGCVAQLDEESVIASVDASQSIVLVDAESSFDVSIVVSERHSETSYVLAMYGKEAQGEWRELASSEATGSFSGPVPVAIPGPGQWQTELRLLDPESSEPLVFLAGPTIEAHEEDTLKIQPVEKFDSWITGHPMPLSPAITPQELLPRLEWRVEMLRASSWVEIAILDGPGSELPPFGEDDEAIQSLRFVAYSDQRPFTASEPFELRVASPGTLIRELWMGENNQSTPEGLWEQISNNTYPGIQNPTEEDFQEVLRIYRNQGMPRTSVLLETLVEVPTFDTATRYSRNPCADPDVIAGDIPGQHFLYDIIWYMDRDTDVATFWNGRMYLHRSLCYR